MHQQATPTPQARAGVTMSVMCSCSGSERRPSSDQNARLAAFPMALIEAPKNAFDVCPHRPHLFLVGKLQRVDRRRTRGLVVITA